MTKSMVSTIPLPEFFIWEKRKRKRAPISFDLEVTARCNNNCRHCYINLPAGDKVAREKELSFEDIKAIADEAISLGVLWCLITGGEPLLREDIFDIYLYLKKRGLLVSIFTNATLVTEEHVRLFKKYPPRDIEVSVYGVTEQTYERVTRRPGSFADFMHGLDLLLVNKVKVRLKSMALRSNAAEMPEIVHFCQERTRDYFRFDPFLHLRFDRNRIRNREIKSERLSPEEIVALERSSPERVKSLEKMCEKFIVPSSRSIVCNHLFRCGAANCSFNVSYDGLFRLCSSLCQPACTYNLSKGNLTDAWWNFVPWVRNMRSNSKKFLAKCGACSLTNLCMWCPAYAYLETGQMDAPVDYFCVVAHSRAEAFKKSI